MCNNKWSNVSRCGIDSFLPPLGCVTSWSHICIFRILNSFPPSLTLLRGLLGPLWVGWGCAGALDNSCSSELCSQLPPSVWSWNLKYLTDFLESVEETHFSSHRCPLQALMMFIPDFSPCLLWHQASLTAAPLWFLFQLCSHKASGCQNQMDGSLQPLGCLEF